MPSFGKWNGVEFPACEVAHPECDISWQRNGSWDARYNDTENLEVDTSIASGRRATRRPSSTSISLYHTQ